MQISRAKPAVILTVIGIISIYIMLNFPSHHFPSYLLLSKESPYYAAKNISITRTLSGQAELTIRMPATENMIKRFMCDLMRSTVLFWNPNYGSIHIILDEKDGANAQFTNMLKQLDLPFIFRFTYEPEPKNVNKFKDVASLIGKPYGYVIQLYSSFLMDLYTNASIIAWTDTDTVFTQPVVDDHIMRNGKLVVKGMNTFSSFSWILKWDRTNIRAIHLPMASDFMTYFPVFVYADTMKNCREFIMSELGVTNFEDAFVYITNQKISPVSIIMSYAYYFERDLYEWHIDIGEETLQEYNQKRLPKHPLQLEDIQPELHLTVHTGYYFDTYSPLERSICFIQLRMGLKTAKLCQHYAGKINNQLFEFCNHPVQNHLNTWCVCKEGRTRCDELINQAYSRISQLYFDKRILFNTSLINSIEHRYMETYNTKCPALSYEPFNML